MKRLWTPGAPVDSLALFAGHMEQVKDVINAVGQRGQHVVLYGERGVGKLARERLSEGLPYYTHLPGLHSAQRPIMDDRGEIQPADVAVAIGRR